MSEDSADQANPQGEDTAPADSSVSAKLKDLQHRLELAQDPGSESAKAKRDAAGLTTPRQRIDALLD